MSQEQKFVVSIVWYNSMTKTRDILARLQGYRVIPVSVDERWGPAVAANFEYDALSQALDQGYQIWSMVSELAKDGTHVTFHINGRSPKQILSNLEKEIADCADELEKLRNRLPSPFIGCIRKRLENLTSAATQM